MTMWRRTMGCAMGLALGTLAAGCDLAGSEPGETVAAQQGALSVVGGATVVGERQATVAVSPVVSPAIASRSLDLTQIREVAANVPNLRIEDVAVVHETLRDFFFLNFDRLRQRLGEVNSELYRLDVMPDGEKPNAGVVAFQTSSARAADIFKEELAGSKRGEDFVYREVPVAPQLPGAEVSAVHETLRDFFFLNFERLRDRLAEVDSQLYRLDVQPDGKEAQAGRVAFETTSPKAADIFREELKVAERETAFNYTPLPGPRPLGSDVSVVHETIRDFFFLNFERLKGRLADVDKRLYQLDVSTDGVDMKAGKIGFQTTSPKAAQIFRSEIETAGRAADFVDSANINGKR